MLRSTDKKTEKPIVHFKILVYTRNSVPRNQSWARFDGSPDPTLILGVQSRND